MHDTLRKFNYPEMLVHENEHWAVLVRPRQLTVGSLVVVYKDDVQSMADIPAEGFEALKPIFTSVENGLRETVQAEKFNYVTLMMVDKQVHFHVFPRYEGGRELAGISVIDENWPKPPVLGAGQELNQDQMRSMRDVFKKVWH